MTKYIEPREGDHYKKTDGVTVARLNHIDNHYLEGEYIGSVYHLAIVNGQTIEWPESARRFTLRHLVGWELVKNPVVVGPYDE